MDFSNLVIDFARALGRSKSQVNIHIYTHQCTQEWIRGLTVGNICDLEKVPLLSALEPMLEPAWSELRVEPASMVLATCFLHYFFEHRSYTDVSSILEGFLYIF